MDPSGEHAPPVVSVLFDVPAGVGAGSVELPEPVTVAVTTAGFATTVTVAVPVSVTMDVLVDRAGAGSETVPFVEDDEP
jgi:hypothetical protein